MSCVGAEAPVVEASTAASAPRPQMPLRVIFCTRGGLFGALVLQRLWRCAHLQLCGIVLSTRHHHPQLGFLRGAWRYIRGSGLRYALYLVAATSIADAICPLAGIGESARRLRRLGVPIHRTRDINTRRSLQYLSSHAPDLIVSAFFDQRLQEPALAISRYANLNIHPSLLPALRGVDPVLQARLQGRPLGVSVHFMQPQLDTGNLLAQQALDLPERVSALEATARLFDLGAALLVQRLPHVAAGERGVPQPPGGSYQSWPTCAEVRAFRRGGGRLLRWSDVSHEWDPERCENDIAQGGWSVGGETAGH